MIISPSENKVLARQESGKTSDAVNAAAGGKTSIWQNLPPLTTSVSTN